jgi:hypothetical protein
MRTLVQRLKRLWHTPVEFYGVDRPEPQAGPWHGLLLFVVLLVILGLLWLIRYLPERTYLVHDGSDVVRGAHMATSKRFTCRFCGRVLPAWLPAAQAPDGARLLHHLSRSHPTRSGATWIRCAATRTLPRSRRRRMRWLRIKHHSEVMRGQD